MKPFDRNNFALWIGALLMAMRHIGKEAQQRHGAKESGLRWGQSAPRVRCGSHPMAAHRASRRACPESRFAAIKLTSYCPVML
ncbi:MAG: hypothetical protein HOB82_08865 [Alphaproteobacteria bacterium]|jgi:hypothetical protein|nr:hypothetical protein [Alphaproteobacteria bacterium]MBT5860292.1 hypothetical protein [Alphaproteobacteria bacterium]